MADDQIRASLRRHAQTVDFAVSRFSSELDAVVSRAQAMLQQQLMSSLALDPVTHKVLRNAKNVRILKRIPQLWKQALDEAGLDAAVTRYLSAYPQQIPAFRDVLEAVNQQANEPVSLSGFTGADQNYFSSLSVATAEEITNGIEAAANGVITKTVLATGAIGFRDLTSLIVKTTNVTKSRAATLANTSLQVFYASVQGAGYEKIQSKASNPLLFRYAGPDDSLCRPFCHRLIESGKTYTRDEIEHMDNGQLPNPFITKGGWNCRHNWILSLKKQ